MKSIVSDRGHSAAPDAAPPRRRSLLLGAGVAGAAAVAAKVLPGTPQPQSTTAPTKQAADTDGGYQLTQHVLRYYETTRV